MQTFCKKSLEGVIHGGIYIIKLGSHINVMDIMDILEGGQKALANGGKQSGYHISQHLYLPNININVESRDKLNLF